VLIIRALWTLFYLIAASCAASAGANYVDRQGWFAAAVRLILLLNSK
jgi:hypothetical protein